MLLVKLGQFNWDNWEFFPISIGMSRKHFLSICLLKLVTVKVYVHRVIFVIGCEPVFIYTGSVTYNKDRINGVYPYGTSVQQYCSQVFYKDTGSDSRWCQWNGQWNGLKATCILGNHVFDNFYA